MLRKLIQALDLRNEIEDFKLIHSEIEKGVVFKGTNLWILVFAIVVASVGLNTNSTAVIIGAMLISPLMGPINGMGYSVATYNFELFGKSIKNFGFAVLTSLVSSTLYFLISPVSTAHSELLARTHPTIYDVMIALFGGLAGIMALSSKLKGNVLPGVAIATALMPPLCTAGFGLATGQFNFFFGAMYLFTINTVFIGISSVLLSRLLRFPIDEHVDESKKNRVKGYITIITVITIVPSIIFGYRLVQDENFTKNATLYCNNITAIEGAYLLKNEIGPSLKTIRLVYGGNNLSEAAKSSIRDKAADFGLTDASITIDQGFALDENVSNENETLKAQINAMKLALLQKQSSYDSISNTPLLGNQILKEIKPLFGQIQGCAFSETLFYNDSTTQNKPTKLVVFTIDEKNKLDLAQELNVINWLKAKLNSNAVKVYFEPVLVE
jgi:uncharacterized hydrophobic protein (TIGR00271 family)